MGSSEINNFVFADGNNFVFADGNNFVFVDRSDLSDNANQLIDYYANLLIIQYHNKPKAKATIEALTQELVANGVYFDVLNGYNIETAVGKQLDVLGKYIGVDRYYEGQTFSGFFSLITYDEVDTPPVDRIGFSDYTDFETKEGKTLTYGDIVSTTFSLPDSDYRFLLKLKIIINNCNFSHKTIDDAIFGSFGLNLIPSSSGNMQMVYFFTPAVEAIVNVAKQKELLPKPMGVGLNYLIPDLDYFSLITYDEVDSDIIADKKGFSDYADYDTTEGYTLTYSNLIE